MKLLILTLVIFVAAAIAKAEPPALKFSDVRLSNGVRLNYVEQGDPRGPVVIMLHGYGDSWFSYARVLPLMSSKYHVYVLDQRGHGNSDVPPGGYRFSDFAADVVAFMDSKKIQRASIVGHSMGSFVAQHVAAQAPERVTRLVLVGSATTVRNEVVLGLKREVDHLTDPVSRKFVREFQSSVIAQPVPEEFFSKVIDESMKVPARVWRDTMSGMLASEPVQLSKITAPTLIIWGDRETVFADRSDQEDLASEIPNAVLVVYEEIGHCPNWEAPARMAKDLAKFLG